MIDADKPTFKAALVAAYELHDKNISDIALRMWWGSVKHMPIDVFLDALQRTIATSKYLPKPADVNDLVLRGDGRPTADESWPAVLAASDEADSICWTQEMAHAWGVARPLYADGDAIGARMAYRAAYERAVEDARRTSKPAKWSVSMGHDPARRVDCVREAAASGLLPAPEASATLRSLGYKGDVATAMLTHDREPEADVQRLTDTIREALAKTGGGE